MSLESKIKQNGLELQQVGFGWETRKDLLVNRNSCSAELNWEGKNHFLCGDILLSLCGFLLWWVQGWEANVVPAVMGSQAQGKV